MKEKTKATSKTNLAKKKKQRKADFFIMCFALFVLYIKPCFKHLTNLYALFIDELLEMMKM